MAAVDQHKALRALDARIAETEHEPQRRMLACVREHIRAESFAEFDALMATMSPEPAFHLWVQGNGNGGGPKGRDAVAAHYRRLYEEARHIFELDIERIVVDHRTVVTEGWFRQVYRGAVLEQRGVTGADPDELYLVTIRLLLLWPFDDQGRLIGEDSYAAGDMFDPANVRQLSPAERDEILVLMRNMSA